MHHHHGKDAEQQDYVTMKSLDFMDSECISMFVQLNHFSIHSLTQWRTYLSSYPLTHSLTHSPTYSFTRSPTHPLTHSFTHSLTHSLTHPLTHSPTLSTLFSASTDTMECDNICEPAPPGDNDGVVSDNIAAATSPVAENLVSEANIFVSAIKAIFSSLPRFGRTD